MFGYVVIHKPELKVKDLETYQSFYCGLCVALKKRHGFFGRLTLNYDMTMAVLLLTGLYEPETEEKRFRCVVHPSGKHVAKTNRFSDYAADMNVFLAYEKAADDVRDEGKLTSRLAAAALKRKAAKVRERWPRQTAAIEENLAALCAAEQRGETDLDVLSGCFGRIMEEIFAADASLWEKDLRRFGFFLGKSIYLLDAYDDLAADEKKGCFNPLRDAAKEPDFETWIGGILEMMMAEAAYAFEMLPIIDHADILRNIIYAGVWTKFRAGKEEERKIHE